MWRLLQILEKRGYQVQLRGVVPVKGKGNMETYYVMGRKAGHAPGFVRQPSTYSSLATVVYGMLQARRRQTIKKSATSKWHLRVMYELTNPYRFHIQNPTGLSLHFLNKNTVLFLGDTESCCTSGINVVVQSVGTGACSTSCTSMVGQSVRTTACSTSCTSMVGQSVGTAACSTSCTSMVGQSVGPAACSTSGTSMVGQSVRTTACSTSMVGQSVGPAACSTSCTRIVGQSVRTTACSTSCTSMVGQSVWPAACSSNPWWQTSVENWRNDKWQWKTELQSLKKTWLNATFVHHKSHMACFGIKSDTVKITCNSKSGC